VGNRIDCGAGGDAVKQKFAYMIVTKKGNPVIHNGQLPIYWRRSVAVQDAQYYCPGADVVRIKMPSAGDAA
jgi:hypothetical protein